MGFFTDTDVVPSEWHGNYTCPQLSLQRDFQMNITRSETIETVGSLHIDGVTVPVTGSYATSFQILTLQSDHRAFIFGQNIPSIELDGQMINSMLITGNVVLNFGNNQTTCPMELRRFAGRCQHVNYYYSFEKDI